MTAFYRNPAEEANILAPAGGLVSGQLVQHASRTWLYQGLQNAAADAPVNLVRGVVVELNKALSTDVYAVGDRIGYNATTRTAVPAGHANQTFEIYGTVRRASGSGAATVWVALDDSGEQVVIPVRRRISIADINAGVNLLPALPGRRYRLIDCAMISIGGAAGAATSVDLRATQSASVVNLVANAVAGLTQNTLLRAGATNSAILAGGLSFVANDVNTPVTVARTGSNVTTATHVDVIATFAVE